MDKKTGISMSGSIEYTSSKKTKEFIKKIDSTKKRNAKICITCDQNKEGWCEKYKGWCGKVNHSCSCEKSIYDTSQKTNVIRTKQVARKEIKNIKDICSVCNYNNKSGYCNKFKRRINDSIIKCERIKNRIEDSIIFSGAKKNKRNSVE